MKTFKSINPYTLNTINEHECLTAKQVESVLEQSKNAFRHWRETSLEERKYVLKNAAIILRKNKEQYAQLITTEMGKVIIEARQEIEKCANTLEYYAQHGETYLQQQNIITTAKNGSYVVYEPLGTLFAIMPWNYPFWQVVRYAAPCLLSGNVTILKHAPNVFGCAKALEKIFLEAGATQGVFQNIIIDIDLVEQIIANDAVQGITLTGSEKAGSQVAMLAGKHIKKTVMELGGSDAFIVLEDADVEQAAKVATTSRMMNAGQACICAKRFIVTQNIYENFKSQFLEEIKKIKIGNPLDENMQMGPMARIDLTQAIAKQVDISVLQGASLLVGGEQENCFYTPSLLSNIKKGMPVYEQETFGPLATIIIVANAEEAVKIANDSRYGLGASLWSKDIEQAQKLARRIDAGNVFINTLVHSDPRLPFGGIKKSGYGRELSQAGMNEFVNVKTIYIN